jgi:hypothetical protein
VISAKQSQFLPQAQETKAHLSAMTIYFCSAWAWRVFRQTCGFSISSNSEGRRPSAAFAADATAPLPRQRKRKLNFAEQTQFLFKLKEKKDIYRL